MPHTRSLAKVDNHYIRQVKFQSEAFKKARTLTNHNLRQTCLSCKKPLEFSWDVYHVDCRPWPDWPLISIGIHCEDEEET